jgi:diacylglycerol O-acyltransferase
MEIHVFCTFFARNPLFQPACIGRPLWHILAYKVTVSMSNVPGFQQRLSFCDAPVDEFLFFVAPNRNLGNFVCIMSYADKVSFGYVADTRLIPDPLPITRLFAAEVECIRRAVEM